MGHQGDASSVRTLWYVLRMTFCRPFRSLATVITLAGASSLTTSASAGEWSAGATMVTPRYWSAAVVLDDGRVLTAGGQSTGGTITNTAEILDPDTNLWTPTDGLPSGIFGHELYLLPDGRVLCAAAPTPALFDPDADTWTPTPSPSAGRFRAATAQLADGSVFHAGGTSNNGASVHATAEIFDAAADAWIAAGTLATARENAAAATLADGRVLVAGGTGGIPAPELLTSVEIYDPVLDVWGAAAPMNVGRLRHALVVLDDGRVLAVGGTTTATVEVYDPEEDAWTSVALPLASSGGLVATTPSGKVLIGVGNGNGLSAEVMLFDPATDAVVMAPSMNAPRWLAESARLPDGTTIVIGGASTGEGLTYLATTEILSLDANGTPCTTPLDCTSGFCVDSVCCDAACEGGPCDSCAAADGADEDGLCTAIPAECDDGDACTEGDLCEEGACRSVPVECEAGECEASSCDAESGDCAVEPLDDGTPCVGGTCQDGLCEASEGEGGSDAGPSTAAATSSASTAASTGSGGDDGGATADDDGCGCEIPGHAAPPRGWLAAALALGLVGVRRGARRRGPRAAG
jgi:hypothetical protein